MVHPIVLKSQSVSFTPVKMTASASAAPTFNTPTPLNRAAEADK
jgi:hypothetical protein